MHFRPPPTLQYADPPSRWGITLQRHPGGLRVVVPPVPSWWHLPKAYLAVVLIGGGLAAFFSFQAIGIGSAPQPTMLLDAGLYGFVALAAVAHAILRLRHRVVLDVTRDTFALAFVNRSGRGRRAVWKRCEVRDVKLNGFNGKLLIRIADQDFIEFT
jgi:hypothetical protein